jgi:N-acetylglucosaminyl-diphospho-decaprenol L-rhamnosyltransferase
VNAPPPRDPRVSVVIVNYRSYPELRECLSSLERCTAAVRTIVVDQQSDPAAAAGIAERFPQVVLVPVERNTGFAAGVNRGARDARTPYLLLLNPDAIAEPDLCEWLSDWLDAHPDVGIAGPRLQNEDGSVQASARRFPDCTTVIAGRSSWLTRVLPGNRLSRRNLPGRDASAREPVDVDWVSGACMMIRRAAFEAIGGMDEGFFLYWEDADFCRRAARAGWRTVYCPIIGARHAGGRSSRHAADASLLAFHQSAFRLFARIAAPVVLVALRVRLAFLRHRARARERTLAAR